MKLSARARNRAWNRSSGIEMLEHRCLLTAKMPAQITIKEIPNTLVSGTSELLITGTKKNDGITINDNGTGTAGNMFVSLSDGRDFMSTGAVTEVAVSTGTGNDHVTYELDGNLQTTESRTRVHRLRCQEGWRCTSIDSKHRRIGAATVPTSWSSDSGSQETDHDDSQRIGRDRRLSYAQESRRSVRKASNQGP